MRRIKLEIWLLLPLIAGMIYVVRQHFLKPDIAEEIAAFNAASELPGAHDQAPVSIPGKELKYDASQRLFGSLDNRDLIGKPAAKSRYIAQSAKPMLDSRLSVTLEDMGVAASERGVRLEGIKKGAELDGYAPETEESLLIKAAKKKRERRGDGVRGRKRVANLEDKKFKSSALEQLKTASKMGAVALEAQDEDAQLLLSRAFVTGENPKNALEKVRRERENSGSKSKLISSLVSGLAGFLNPGGMFNWNSLISGKTLQTREYETVDQAKSCEVCGTVSWEAVLAGPGVVGEPAPTRASPYSVELSPKKHALSISLLDIK